MRKNIITALLLWSLSTRFLFGQIAIPSSPPSKGANGLYGYQNSFVTGSGVHVTSISLNKYYFITGGMYGF